MMETREWALIAFTILSQMSIGAFVVLGIVHFFAARKAGLVEADRLSNYALYAIGPTLVLGIIASFFHLGNPMNGPQAIANFGSSWLSREIVFVVAFCIVGAVFAFMQWRHLATPVLRTAVAWLAALLGLAQVFSMSQVYMLPTQPYWNTAATVLAFFATTFLLGALSVGAALVATYAYVRRKTPSCAEAQCTLLRDTVKGIAVAVVVLLGIQLIAAPLQLALLASQSEPAGVQSAGLLYQDYGLLYGLRLVLAFVGAGLFGLYLYRNASVAGREKLMGSAVYVAFAIVLVAEVLGRFLFYAAHVKVGLG
jgi:anaerobic dimethyl sulfoxide reductase subunit C (anchor subunit)